MTCNAQSIDKALVARRFAHARDTYGNEARVQQQVAEKMLRLLDREVPHGVAVGIERWNEREDGLVEINAVIYCEKASHKGIIIGKRGAMLKEIGQQARADIERMLDAKVFLELWVKVKEGWRNNQLRNFGYEDQ